MFELWGVWTDLERVKGNAKQLELICVSLEVGGGGVESMGLHCNCALQEAR